MVDLVRMHCVLADAAACTTVDTKESKRMLPHFRNPSESACSEHGSAGEPKFHYAAASQGEPANVVQSAWYETQNFVRTVWSWWSLHTVLSNKKNDQSQDVTGRTSAHARIADDSVSDPMFPPRPTTRCRAQPESEPELEPDGSSAVDPSPQTGYP